MTLESKRCSETPVTKSAESTGGWYRPLGTPVAPFFVFEELPRLSKYLITVPAAIP